jgi:hypothetical protein
MYGISSRKIWNKSDAAATITGAGEELGLEVNSWVTDPYGRILGFLGRNRYFFSQVAPQFYSRG